MKDHEQSLALTVNYSIGEVEDMTYTTLQIAERVHAYLWRNSTDKKVGIWPFDCIKTFQIFSGALNARGKREAMTPLYHGRFLDVVAKAVQLEGFTTKHAPNPGDINAGYIALWEQPVAEGVPGRPAGLEKMLKKLVSEEKKKRK